MAARFARELSPTEMFPDDPIIGLAVGPKKEFFDIHLSIIQAYLPTIEAKLGPSNEEGQHEDIIHMPDMKHTDLSIVLAWCYEQNIISSDGQVWPLDKGTFAVAFDHLIVAYGIAASYHSAKMQSDILSIVKKVGSDNGLPLIKLYWYKLFEAYKAIPAPDDEMKKFLLKCFVWYADEPFYLGTDPPIILISQLQSSLPAAV